MYISLQSYHCIDDLLLLHIHIFIGRNGLSVFQMLAAKYNLVITHVDYFAVKTNVKNIKVEQQLTKIRNKG